MLIIGLAASQSGWAQSSCLNFSSALAHQSGDANPNAVATADFNGDGKADLAVTHELQSDIGVLLNNGNGTFAPAVVYGSGGHLTNSVAVADLNADGKVDLAVASHGGDGDIGVLMNNGNGTFAPAVVYSANGGGQTLSVVVGDFNGDGKVDLAAANQATSSVSVLLNNGNGTLAPPCGLSNWRYASYSGCK